MVRLLVFVNKIFLELLRNKGNKWTKARASIIGILHSEVLNKNFFILGLLTNSQPPDVVLEATENVCLHLYSYSAQSLWAGEKDLPKDEFLEGKGSKSLEMRPKWICLPNLTKEGPKVHKIPALDYLFEKSLRLMPKYSLGTP